MDYHKICGEIKNCDKGCFRDRYQDYLHNGQQYSKNYFCSISPMASVPLSPKVLLISQNPPLQAWINAGLNGELPDGGLISGSNEFFVNNLLPVFGLDSSGIELFRETVAWVHLVNCHPWFSVTTDGVGRESRQDKTPTTNEINNCIRSWLEPLLQIESMKLVVPMGKPALSLFFKLGDNNYTEIMKTVPFFNDTLLPKKILFPIFHQSGRSKIFNDPKCLEANEKAIALLDEAYEELTKEQRNKGTKKNRLNLN